MPHGAVLQLAATDWGSIPGWATVVALAALAWALLRGGTGTAVGGLQATNRELQRQITELKGQVNVLSKENAELRGRTDVAVAMRPVIDAVMHHERQADKRSMAMLDVLDMIATRLGKETEG